MSADGGRGIALLGGSFNPVHMGHIMSARAAFMELRPRKLLMLPVSAPPHKELPADSPCADERLLLLSLAVADEPGVEISDIELQRGKVSYTEDTIRELRNLYPAVEIYLLMGADMFLAFESWRNFQYIADNATLAVFCRRSGEREIIYAHAVYMENKYNAGIRFVDHEPLDISSTELRVMLRERQGRQFLPEEVYCRIIKKRHYGAKPELEWLRERVAAYLNPGRVAHVRGCEEEAVKLARRWGSDEGEAAEAAILHDITKNLPADKQLILCKKYAIIVDDTEISNPKLLHAKTGAALAGDEYGISGQVYDAIYWHTTGRREMSKLEKILYLADYIEPNREFTGLRELRELSYSDIDAAMEMGLRMSIEELLKNGSKIHPRSTQALHAFQNRRG